MELHRRKGYLITTRDYKKKQVDALAYDFSHAGFNLFAHRDTVNLSYPWCVAEKSTGLSVCHSFISRRDAIDAAIKYIESQGTEHVKKLIVQGLAKITDERRNLYRVDGEIYRVADVMATDDPDWYEYTVTLFHGAEVVASWDSLTETYNGLQRLTKEKAEKALQDVIDHVAAGNDPREYFTY
jgi:hypothetical protein